VSELCALIGQRLGFDPDRIEELRLAGLLHDVGKVGVSDAVLQKQEELGEQEVGEMRGHVAIGHAIVSAAELAEPADWILHHHERVDGAGYPHGLRDEEIPLESRIIGVADAFEAMTADRPYRAGCSTEEALAELARHSGKQFDPRCLAALEQTVALIAPRTSQLETQTGAGGRAPRLLAAPGEAGRGPVEAAIAALPERAA
jgi:HD-GYP domain-containing protein (c-di-GMP phosphodiesterase class II)